jgi:5-hydroxyisourate hydrolase-like protein (transthyretin family)
MVSCLVRLDNNYTQTGIPLTTNAQGQCHLTQLLSGESYLLSWNSQEKGNLTQGSMTFTAAENTKEPIRFTARVFHNTLSGHVVDSKGSPVANARFEFHNSDMVYQQNWQQLNAGTKADGAFKFEQLADGMVELVIQAPGFRRTTIVAPTNKTDFKAVVHSEQEPAQQQLLVSDLQGNPLTDIPVTICYQEQNTPQPMQETRNTDTDGVIDLSDIATSNMVTAICDQDGYGVGAVSFGNYEEGMHRIVMRKTSDPWRVRVIDVAGKPLPGIMLKVNSYAPLAMDEGQSYNSANLGYAVPQETLASAGLVQQTDADGRATFPRISHKQQLSLQVQDKVYGHQYKSLQA